jgi:hypothetical protein
MTIKTQILQTLDKSPQPVTAVDISRLTGIAYDSVAAVLAMLFNGKKVRRAADPSVRTLRYLYVKPEAQLDGFELISRRRSYACRRKPPAGVRRLPVQAMKSSTNPPTKGVASTLLLVPVGTKSTLELSFDEARALYSELAAIFGGVASSTK